MAENPERDSERLTSFSPEAEKDIDAIYFYTAQLWGEAQADRYFEFLLKVTRQLAHNPMIAPLVPNLTGVRSYAAIWKSARQGHRIFFKETDAGIFVIRILHTAMSWHEHLG